MSGEATDAELLASALKAAGLFGSRSLSPAGRGNPTLEDAEALLAVLRERGWVVIPGSQGDR